MDNWKEIAYLLGFGQGLILSLSLIIRGINGHRSGLFLGLILLVLVQELLNAWGMQVRYHSRPDAFHFWNFQSYLLLPLALWFFVKYTTEADFVFKPKFIFYFLPLVFEVATRWFLQLYQDISQRPVPSLLNNPVWFFATEILPISGMVVVLGVYGSKLVKIWKQQKPPLGLYPRYFGLWLFLLLLTLLWIAGVMVAWPVFTGIEILIMTFLFALGYTGYIDPDFFILPAHHAANSPFVAKQVENPDFARYDTQKDIQTLRNLFLQEKLYTRPRLTLEEVAIKLHLPGRYISHLINSHYNTNFNGFVNVFRVEEVLRKLADPADQHKTILALALEAGFNSKSAFNQVFRQHTGQSPSQFLRSQKGGSTALSTVKI